MLELRDPKPQNDNLNCRSAKPLELSFFQCKGCRPENDPKGPRTRIIGLYGLNTINIIGFRA